MSHPCPRFEPDLSAYLDGETPAPLRAEIDAHLRTCAACRAAVAQLRDVSRTLRRWDAHETRYAASTGFRNRVFGKVGAEGVPPRTNTLWRVAAAAALVAVGASGFALVAPRLRSGESEQYVALASDLVALRKALQAQPPRAESPALAPTGPSIARVEPLGTVISRPETGESPPAAQPDPEVWEQRNDERFLREALVDHDAYTRERRILALFEQWQKQQEAAAGKSDRATAAQTAPTSPLATFLGELRVSETNFPPAEQVQVWPLELVGARASDRPRVVTCSDAIAQEFLAVTEGPSREWVVAVNKDPNQRPVLVLAGDILAGGKQDRVAREDVLVAPGQRLLIPTYACGGERNTSYVTFRHSDGLATPDLRALIAADRALLVGGVGQDEFDAAVGRTVTALATTRGLGSLDNLFSNPQLDGVVGRLMKKFEKRLEGSSVVGFAFAAGSQVLGVEAFGDHATFVAHRARVLRSYVMAAIAMDLHDGTPPSRSAIADVVAAAPKSAFPPPEAPGGSGALNVFRSVEGGSFGFGLLDGTRVVHALLFTSLPTGVDATTARTGRRNPGDSTLPTDGGGHGSSSRGSSGGGEGVEPK